MLSPEPIKDAEVRVRSGALDCRGPQSAERLMQRRQKSKYIQERQIQHAENKRIAKRKGPRPKDPKEERLEVYVVVQTSVRKRKQQTDNYIEREDLQEW